MSTTIDVHPSRWDLPRVEQTRARTEQLFQELLRRHGVASTLTIEAFLPNDDGAFLIAAPEHIRWHPGLDLRFAYFLNGVAQASSWPTCLIDDEPRGALDDWIVAEELGHRLPRERLIRAYAIPHYWYEYRNMGGHAVASIGYGLVAAAIAEQTNGLIVSWDSAFDWEHCGEGADEFLAWWGDRQIEYYGTSRFEALVE